MPTITFPKGIMSKKELKAFGFSDLFLRRATRLRGHEQWCFQQTPGPKGKWFFVTAELSRHMEDICIAMNK